MEPSRPFPYGRAFFYQRAFLLLLLIIVVLIFFSLQLQTPAEWIAVLATVLGSYVVVVGLSPLLTQHTLTRSRIILRQGWYFRAIVPLAEAESISLWDGVPKYGLRLSVARRTLFVVGSAHNLVSVRLLEPRRFPHVLFLSAKEIVFDVDDRDAFLAAVQQRQETREALPAHKVRALPPRR